MKRWMILVLSLILLAQFNSSSGRDDITDSGKNSMFNFPIFKMPIGDRAESKNDGEKKEEGEQTFDQKRKQIQEKSVDDAIKKAWDEN